MTREKAIEIFQRMKKILSIPNSDAAKTIETLDMAIHALEQEPTAEYSSDVISRQAAIDALCEDLCGGWHDCKDYPECENLKPIQQLSSAEPCAEPCEDKRTDKRTETHARDFISRQAAIDAIEKYDFFFPEYMERFVTELRDAMKKDLLNEVKSLPNCGADMREA